MKAIGRKRTLMVLGEVVWFLVGTAIHAQAQTLLLSHWNLTNTADVATGSTTPIYWQGTMAADQGILGARCIALTNTSDLLIYSPAGNFNVASGTIEMWIKPNVANYFNGSHGIFYTYGGGQDWYLRTVSAGVLQYVVTSNGVGQFANAPLTWASATWHHVAATWGSMGMRLFADGVLVASNSFSGAIPSSSAGLYVGTLGGQANAFFDDLRIRSDQLSDAAIYTDYTNGLAGIPVFALTPEPSPNVRPLFLAHWNSSTDADYARGGKTGVPTAGACITNAGAKFGGGSLDLSTSTRNMLYPGIGNLNPTRGTVELWVRPEGPPGANYCATSHRLVFLTDGSNQFIVRAGDGAGVGFFYITNGVNNVIAFPAAWTDAGWHHVAVTWGSPGMRIYLDGELAISNTFVGTVPSMGSSLYVGSPYVGQETYARLDELRILEEQLTPAQVLSDYLRTSEFTIPMGSVFSVH